MRCPSLEALVAEVVVAQVNGCDGPVDANGVGEGLQRWHGANGQDSRLVGVSLRLFCIMHCQLFHISGTNMNKGQAKIVDMSPT